MATERQKEAARKNLVKARRAQSARANGRSVPRSTEGMSTAEKDRLDDREFAFPDERKEPLDGRCARAQRHRPLRPGGGRDRPRA